MKPKEAQTTKTHKQVDQHGKIIARFYLGSSIPSGHWLPLQDDGRFDRLAVGQEDKFTGTTVLVRES